MFFGALLDIPSGWIRCDGNNGTPDLEDRMIVGSGSTYAPNDSGGSATHTHDFTSSNHAHECTSGTHIESSEGFETFSDQNTLTGITDAGNMLPPVVALIFIQKT